MITAIRRSIIASKNIKKGELLTLENIVFRRPAIGIPADRVKDVIGKKVISDIGINDFITWENIE